MTKKILEWKPDLSEELDEKGWSPLHLAAYVGCRPEIVRQLLEKCKPRLVYQGLKSYGNRTALHIAAGRGHVDMVKELASRFPDCCEKVDDNGNNVLHLIMLNKIFVSSGLSNIRWLRVKGLMNQKNIEGETPLHLLKNSFSSWTPVQTMSSFIKLILSTLKSVRENVINSFYHLGICIVENIDKEKLNRRYIKDRSFYKLHPWARKRC